MALDAHYLRIESEQSETIFNMFCSITRHGISMSSTMEAATYGNSAFLISTHSFKGILIRGIDGFLGSKTNDLEHIFSLPIRSMLISFTLNTVSLDVKYTL